MKKMNLVTKGLVLLLMGAMLAGCSDKGAESTVEGSSEEVQESVSKQTEEASQEASVESSSEAQAGSSETNQGSEDDSELVAQYEEYFNNFTFDGRKFVMSMSADTGETAINLDIDFGIQDGESYLRIAVPQDAAENSMTLYFLKDSSAYLEINAQGQAPAKYKTDSLDQNTASQLNPASSILNLDEPAGRDLKLKYVGEETIDGVTYDVLASENEESTAYMYMNQKTKEWEKMKASAEGQDVMVDILPVDPIKLPEGFDSAEELDGDSFAMTMALGMVGLIAGPDALNFGE